MHTGMLWLDNSNAALALKIQKAVDYYIKKYGRQPDLCLVHPSMLETPAKDDHDLPSKSSHLFAGEKDQAQPETPALGAGASVSKLTVRPYRPVLPGHLWIGIEEMPAQVNGD